MLRIALDQQELDNFVSSAKVLADKSFAPSALSMENTGRVYAAQLRHLTAGDHPDRLTGLDENGNLVPRKDAGLISGGWQHQYSREDGLFGFRLFHKHINRPGVREAIGMLEYGRQAYSVDVTNASALRFSVRAARTRAAVFADSVKIDAKPAREVPPVETVVKRILFWVEATRDFLAQAYEGTLTTKRRVSKTPTVKAPLPPVSLGAVPNNRKQMVFTGRRRLELMKQIAAKRGTPKV